MSSLGGREATRAAIEAVARRSYGKLVAFLSARTRDVAGAEDALSEAFASALETWPQGGCPSNPEGWLLTAARRKLIDSARRQRSGANASVQLDILTERLESAEAAAAHAEIPDRRLALMFACAHPAIEPAIRAPLILQALLGLDAAMIASAFLMSPAAMAQRLVRAKQKIREAGIPFSVPTREDIPPRLGAVLDAIYAAFTRGWTAPGETDLARRDLVEEAFFLGRLIVELLPQESEALGLLALMLHAEARRSARRNSQGDYVPLAEQDPDLWDAAMIDEAETLLIRAREQGAIGRFQLEGALQSAHAHRRRTGTANWEAVLELYDALLLLCPSPVVAVNRALAVAEVRGAQTALEELQSVAQDVRIGGYQPYWASRAELLARTGARTEARQAYEIAIGLEADPAVRRFLQQRQSALPEG